MQIKFIFPVWVFYVNKIGKNDYVHAVSYGFWITILKKYKDDKGLFAHEMVHIKQFWTRGFLIHKYLYHFWKYYRFKCELDAYVKQWKINKGDEKLKKNYVIRIQKGYGLNYSEEYILKNLTKKFTKFLL